MTRRVRAALPWLLAPVLVVAAGCRGHVVVEVAGDGTTSGTVTVVVELDREVMDALGGVDSIVLEDVRASSWELSEPADDDAGSFVLRAEHDYSGAGDLQAVLDSLAGPGVFTVGEVAAEDGFARHSSQLALDVAVTGSLEQFSDAALGELLGGLPLGYTPEELAFIGADRPGAASMEVEVSVPGGEADTAELDLTGGAAASASLSSTGEDTDAVALVLSAAGATLVLAGLAVAVAWLSQRRRSLRA
ncbi:MAG: hypothetical protein R2716_02310 [Microthrixaceae bacterium]